MKQDDARRLEAILHLYKEQCEHGRHTEGQRERLTAALLALAGGSIATLAALRFSLASLPIALFLAATGVLGGRFARLYEQKWEEAGGRRDFYRTLLQDQLDIGQPTRGASRGGLRLLWRRIFTLVTLFGFLCAAGIVAGYWLG
ncbi:MAG TPA: hypothetical protein VFR28_10305 [Allosphingosinicella sp.]|nr:hypothetical protein [Allosphingosinicella sp.]